MTCIILNCAALVFGGIVDYKKREIPNLVLILLIVSGSIAGRPVLPRIILTLIVAAAFWTVGKLMKKALPAGDMKLVCALTYASGFVSTMIALFFSIAASAVVGKLQHKPVSRHIPLCTYMAGAYSFLCTCLIFLKPLDISSLMW